MLALISIMNVFSFMSFVENWHPRFILCGKLQYQMSLKQNDNCLLRWEHLTVGRYLSSLQNFTYFCIEIQEKATSHLYLHDNVNHSQISFL